MERCDEAYWSDIMRIKYRGDVMGGTEEMSFDTVFTDPLISHIGPCR